MSGENLDDNKDLLSDNENSNLNQISKINNVYHAIYIPLLSESKDLIEGNYYLLMNLFVFMINYKF